VAAKSQSNPVESTPSARRSHPISMTGYGRAEARSGNLAVAVEVKTVNHRYFEASIRLPGGLQELEPGILDSLRRFLRRGRAEVTLHLLKPVAGTSEPVIDTDLAGKYLKALQATSRRLGLNREIDLPLLLKLPQVVRVEERPVHVQSVARLVEKALAQALRKLVMMRTAEGRKLAADIRRRLNNLKQLVRQIQEEYARFGREQEARLTQQIQQWLGGGDSPDTKRLIQDACLKQVRADVTEELVRLQSHFDQFGKFLLGPEPAGRKLDFLIQEMNREINTIGSKAGPVAHRVVAFKEELEKIREQVQNLE